MMLSAARPFACALLLAVIIAGVPAAASAHVSGASWTAASGDYTADVGYDPAALSAGEPVPFDFSLWRGSAETGEAAQFESVWVRITDEGGDMLLATGIWNRSIGPALLYAFPRAGRYTLEVRYLDGERNEIAEASFPVIAPVQNGTDETLPYMTGVFAFLAGAALGALFMHARKRNFS